MQYTFHGTAFAHIFLLKWNTSSLKVSFFHCCSGSLRKQWNTSGANSQTESRSTKTFGGRRANWSNALINKDSRSVGHLDVPSLCCCFCGCETGEVSYKLSVFLATCIRSLTMMIYSALLVIHAVRQLFVFVPSLITHTSYSVQFAWAQLPNASNTPSHITRDVEGSNPAQGESQPVEPFTFRGK